MVNNEPYHIEDFLNFSRRWTVKDVNFLDKLINDPDTDRPMEDVCLLTQFLENIDAWTRVDAILRYSEHYNTKNIALNILEHHVKTKWKTFTRDECLDFKIYIMKQIMMVSGANELSEDEKKILNMLNMILIQILEYEYPKNWPTFVEDLLAASKTRTNWSWNALNILNLMNNKMFGISGKKMSCFKAKAIQESKAKTFSQIFHFCEFVINTSSDATLLHCTLKTLLKFITWIPFNVVFETDFADLLIRKFYDSSDQIIALQLLIAIVNMCDEKNFGVLYQMFKQFILNQQKVLHNKETSNNGTIVENCASVKESNYFSVLFLYTMLRKCGELFRKENTRLFEIALDNLLSPSLFKDIRTVKLYLGCWKILLRYMCLEKMQKGSYNHLFVMSKLRNMIISNITKPDRIIFKNADGYVVGISNIHPDMQQIYENMTDILVFLTFLDHAETVKIIIQKLTAEIEKPDSELSENNLKSLCCAVVAVRNKYVRDTRLARRCMPEEVQRKLFWDMFRGLLTLARVKKRTRNKMAIALNLMYFTGIYALYLNSNWNVLKIFTVKLFEFMKENPGSIQDFACKAFVMVAQLCKEEFIKVQPGETMPYIDEIVNRMDNITSGLHPEHVSLFYQGVGHLVVTSFHTEEEIVKERIKLMMASMNKNLRLILEQADRSPEILQSSLFIDDVRTVLSINTGACRGMGYEYNHQLHHIYEKLLLLYQNLSEIIYCEVQKNGIDVMKQPSIKGMRAIREEILKLISIWIGSIKKKTQCSHFLEFFYPDLLPPILSDYNLCTVPDVCEPGVLLMLTTLVNSLQHSISYKIEKIFSFVLDKTANIISQNSEKFPEIEKYFLMFIQAVITHCFQALLQMLDENDDNFRIIMGSLRYAAKYCHIESIRIIGLQTLLLLLKNVHQTDRNEQFHQTYFFPILENILFIVTDPLYKSGLPYKARILSHMLQLIEKNHIKTRLYPLKQNEKLNNCIYIKKRIAFFLSQKFRHLSKPQIEIMCNGIFKRHKNITSLIKYLKELPVWIQELKEDGSSINS